MPAGRVQAPGLDEILRSHEERISRDAERFLADPSPWIYVGSGAPAPAFQNGYTNVGGAKVPLRYRFLRPYDPARLSDRSGAPQVAVEIQGKVTGGTPGATVFTILVPGFMPDGSAAWTTYTLDYDVELSGGFTALTTGDVVLTPGGSGIQFDIDNVGDSLQIETTGLVPVPFSQPESSRDGATSFGMALNIANGLLLTTPPDSFFNSGEPVLEVDQLVTSGDYGAQGIVVQVGDATPSGTAGVEGIQVKASADGSQEVDGITVAAAMGANGTSDAVAGSFGAANRGSGREVAVTAEAGIFKSGANALCYEGRDAGGNPVFEVYADGNIHIKTGALLLADLP